MRSPEEGEPSLAEARAALKNLPRIKTEAQDSASTLKQASSMETVLSESSLGIQTWDDEGTEIWSAAAEAQAASIRAAEAQAWETRALEAQTRATQSKQSSVEVTPTSVVKHRSSKEKPQVIKKEDSDVSLTRPLWSSKFEYILAQIGYSMRPANFWCFVFLLLHNGGCSFFIIYIFMLFLIGIPLMFLEMAVGQAMHQGSLDLWKIVGPWVGGVGYTMFMVCFITSMYINVVNSWILFYLSQSFQFPVPWEKCPLLKNSSDFDPECARTTPFMYFWYRQTLKASDSIEDSGPPVFSLKLPFFLSWCLVCALMINGLKSTGKVMYVLVSLSCFIILCFFIRSLLLDGTVFGLRHLLVIKVSALYNVTVWCLAGSQVLFDLGLGFGPIVSLSSYLPPSNNCLGDAFVIALIKIVTLLVITPFILSILGFWATVTTHRCCEKNAETLIKLVAQGILPPATQPPSNLLGNPTAIYDTWLNGLPQQMKSLVLSKVPECNIQNQFLKIKEGTRFAFLTIAELISFLPGSVLWSVCFLLLLLTLQLCTMVGFMQGIITPLKDTFIFLRKQPKLLTAGVSLLMFLCGLFFTQPAGSYYITLLSDYWKVLPIIIIIICENIAVAWAYGAKRFLADLRTLLGRPVPDLCGWLWRFVSPVVLLVLFVTGLVRLCMQPITYVAWDSSSSKEVLRQYPPWAVLFMVILTVIILLPIPVCFFYCIIHGTPFRSKCKDRFVISSQTPP